MKHTPGPWEVSQDGALNYTISGHLPYGKGEIATLTSYATHPNGLTYANARLIAAAPELLEALQACVDDGFLAGEVFEQAVATIKKAKGE